MSKFKDILNLPSRWRHSRGFGVHSPFAYKFITNVLRQTQHHYYAYAEIKAFCPRARKAGFNEIFAGRDISVPEGLLIFRLLCYFNPKDVVEIGNGHEVTHVIIERALPHCKQHFASPNRPINSSESSQPFILVNDVKEDNVDTYINLLNNLIDKSDSVIVVRNLRHNPYCRKLWHKLYSNKKSGMAFTDRYMGIFVAHHKLPNQLYDIFF